MKKSHQVHPQAGWKKSLLSLAVGAALCSPVTVMAMQFELADGEVTGALDTTVSYGALWRVTAPDKANIGTASGGTKPNTNY